MKEAGWRSQELSSVVSGFPFSAPPAFQELIAAAEKSGDTDAANALKKQIYPSLAEVSILECESSDPLGEAQFAVLPRLVHQYKSRVLLLSTSKCIGYCRYCFRKSFAAGRSGLISGDELEKVCRYIEAHFEIEEILVSGGDPCAAPFDELIGLLARLRKIRPRLLLRLCTRAPVFAPEILTRERIAALRKMRPLWLVPHINHPAELGERQLACLISFVESGIPVYSQTVLLRDVNDSRAVLLRLFKCLVRIGVKPGYLFQCDLAPGTGHFRVPIARALSIWRDLEAELSGLSRPVFAVDLPGGGGKFPLSLAAWKDSIVSCGEEGLAVRRPDGKSYVYPG